MEFMKAKYEILSNINRDNILKSIEKAGRTCYKSEDKITKDSASKFVKMIVERGHLSVIEHEKVTVKFYIDRGCCYDDKTEVLTKDGWKLFKDTTDKDKFFTLNPMSKYAEYQERIANIVKNWNGDLIYGKSSMVDFAVTPNHRMFWYHYDSRIDRKWKIKTAEEIYNKRVKFKRGLFKPIDSEDNFPNYPQVSDNNFAKFMGIFITDGSLYKGKDTGGRVILSQIKPSIRKYIKELLTELNWNFKINNKGFYINNTKLYNFLRIYFPKHEKKTYHGRIPYFIRNSNEHYIKNFIEGVVVGDDSIHKNNGHVVVYTASYGMAGDLQELFMKIGLCASIRTDDRVEQKRTMSNGNIIENKVVQYIVSVTKRTNDHLFNKKHWYKKQYKGKVYCVSVPNGILYVRRNGKAFWSGNSHEMVRHRLSSFSQESTRYCNYSKKGITYINMEDHFKTPEGLNLWLQTITHLEHIYNQMIEAGESPQIARSILPNCLKTEIVVTSNLRQWKTIFDQRTSSAAHPQMREIMIPLLKEFQKVLPEIYGDE